MLLQKLEGEWRLPRFLYADDLVFCGGSDKDLRTMVERFVEVYRRRGLKINAGKGKVMVVNGEEGLENKVYIDGMRLEWVSEFKYLGCVLGKLGAYETECRRKVTSGRSVACTIMSLVNTRDLQLERGRDLHEICLYMFLCMAVR